MRLGFGQVTQTPFYLSILCFMSSSFADSSCFYFHVFILQAFLALCIECISVSRCLALWLSGLECLRTAVDIWRSIRSCHV